jgi:hypothetical protein
MRSLIVVGLLVGCGDPSAKITVNLSASTNAVLNPFDPSVGISKIRVRVDGPDQHDDAVIDLGLGQKEAVFEKFPVDLEVVVRADGYDAFGNTVAFGRDELLLEEDVTVTLPFRRNLAYVIHQSLEGQKQPEAHVYLIDVVSRTLVTKVKLPGTAPRARGISARGGDSILVTYDDGASGFVGVLSADTNEVRAIPLMKQQALAIASPKSPMAVVAGGGSISFLDLDSGVNTPFPQPVGGVPMDAAIAFDGGRAIVVLDSNAALDIDVDAREVKQLALIPNPSGVAIGFGGKVAFLTSSTEGSVGQVNLEGQDANVIPGGAFVRPVFGAAYSDEMQAVFGNSINPENRLGRTISFIVFPEPEGLPLENGIQTLAEPATPSADGAGRRIVVVSAGTSSATAGLTIVDTFTDAVPDGSSTLYPLDPDDTFLSPKGTLLKQRWRPQGVAVIYGR